jgi:hypothetical protein
LKENIKVTAIITKETIFTPKESEKREKTENTKITENKTVRKLKFSEDDDISDS